MRSSTRLLLHQLPYHNLQLVAAYLRCFPSEEQRASLVMQNIQRTALPSDAEAFMSLAVWLGHCLHVPRTPGLLYLGDLAPGGHPGPPRGIL